MKIGNVNLIIEAAAHFCATFYDRESYIYMGEGGQKVSRLFDCPTVTSAHKIKRGTDEIECAIFYIYEYSHTFFLTGW